MAQRRPQRPFTKARRRSVDLPLKRLGAEFIREEIEGPQYRDGTKAGKRADVNAWVRLLSDAPDHAEVREVFRRHVREEIWQPGTANNRLITLSQLFRWAIATNRWSAVDPTAGILLYKLAPPKPKALPAELYPPILAAMPDDLARAFLSIQYRRGLRVGEALALERPDLEPAGATPQVWVRGRRNWGDAGRGPTKTRKGARVVPLDQETAELLQRAFRASMRGELTWQFRGEAAARFVFPYGLTHRQELLRRIREAAPAAFPVGEHATFHRLRHGFADRVRKAPGDERVKLSQLQAVLGHEHISSTATYYNRLSGVEWAASAAELCATLDAADREEAGRVAEGQRFGQKPEAPAGMGPAENKAAVVVVGASSTTTTPRGV